MSAAEADGAEHREGAAPGRGLGCGSVRQLQELERVAVRIGERGDEPAPLLALGRAREDHARSRQTRVNRADVLDRQIDHDPQRIRAPTADLVVHAVAENSFRAP